MLIKTSGYSDPSSSLPSVFAPPVIRTTARTGFVHSTQITTMGNITGQPNTPANGTITVANNDFSTGRARIQLGDWDLLSGVDFQQGALAANTASLIAAAIAALPGFGATANGAVVTVTYVNTIADIDFRVWHYGTITNFTLSPTTGLLNFGVPAISGPTFT